MVRGSANLITSTVILSQSLRQVRICSCAGSSRTLVSTSTTNVSRKQTLVQLVVGRYSFSRATSHLGNTLKHHLSSSAACYNDGVFGGIVQENNSTPISSDVPLEDVLTYLLCRNAQRPPVIDGEGGSAVSIITPSEIDEWISLRNETISSFTNKSSASSWNSSETELSAAAVVSVDSLWLSPFCGCEVTHRYCMYSTANYLLVVENLFKMNRNVFLRY
eukprot:m.1085738 g.1085738  ORF g.1085738 m.1085738 type:complete len:219 (+) comp24279_c0_seq48:214-870(+)